MACTKQNPCCCDLRVGVIIIVLIFIIGNISLMGNFAAWLSSYETLKAIFVEDSAPVSLETFRTLVIIMLILTLLSIAASIVVLAGAIVKYAKMLYVWYVPAACSLLISIFGNTRGAQNYYLVQFTLSVLLSILVLAYLSWCVQCLIIQINNEKNGLGPNQQVGQFMTPVVVQYGYPPGQYPPYGPPPPYSNEPQPQTGTWDPQNSPGGQQKSKSNMPRGQ